MILLVNPRVCRPENRRFPLGLMSLGSSLPAGRSWEIVDGNHPWVDEVEDVSARIEARRGTDDPVELVAVSVMPGPQLASAVPFTRELKARYPEVPVVWGGYFPSLYPKPVLNADCVDWAVRGQGNHTLVELLDVLDGERDPRTVAGLCFRDGDEHVMGPERPWVGPDELPTPPWHAIDVDAYVHPTFLGERSAVYQASIGCPYGCKFCGVISMLGSREKQEAPERTVEQLRFLVEEHGIDSLHFYDQNFFLAEAHAVELAERMEPLGLSWWCEARIDAMLRFSDATWKKLKASGLKMVFFGAESGSDEVLARMNKKLTTAQIEEVAARTREHGIVPEFSFVLGGPDDPEGEIDTTLRFIRKLKGINPDFELITYFYTPTPQRGDAYGDVDPLSGTPATLEGWTRPEWIRWSTHEDPDVPWMTPELKARVENFTLVLQSRFPSVHDRRTRPWGKALAKVLAGPAWRSGTFDDVELLRRVRSLARVPRPGPLDYGHLRPSAEAVR